MTYKVVVQGSASFNPYSKGYIPHNVVLDQNMVLQYSDYGYDEAAIEAKIKELLALAEVEDKAGTVPDRFQLSQNYPNPFNGSTVISYSLPQNAAVQLLVYDQAGRAVATLIDGTQPAGSYLVTWGGLNDQKVSMPSGVYYYRLKAGSMSETRKMIYLR